MPLLCCGSSSVQVDKLGTKPGDSVDDDENNNKGEVMTLLHIGNMAASNNDEFGGVV